jgi:hypothetical protein
MGTCYVRGMSLPEWIVDQISPKDPEAREVSDRRFAIWVAIPGAVLYGGWLFWRWLTAV